MKVTDNDSGGTGRIESVEEEFLLIVKAKNYPPEFSTVLSDLQAMVGQEYLYTLPNLIDINEEDFFDFQLRYSSDSSFELSDFSTVSLSDEGYP